MRKEAPFFLLLVGLICSLSTCTSGISTDYKRQLETVLNQSSRADSLRLLLHKTPHDEQEAMAYLIAWMPQGDRDTMNLDLLKENVAYACRVRSEFSWTKALPDSIFLNEVLPYAVVDETRDSWRQDFYNRFAPRVSQMCRHTSGHRHNKPNYPRSGRSGIQHASGKDQPKSC